MLPINHAYLPIIGAVAAEMAVGCVWYSDYAFGAMYRQATGKKKKVDMTKEIIMHAAIAIIKATALFIIITMMQKTSSMGYFKEGLGQIFSAFTYDPSQHNNTIACSAKTAGFVWLGLIFPTMATCTIWGSKNWTKLAIVAGGQLAMTMGMAVAIAWLS